MALWTNLMFRLNAAYKAFQEPDLISDPLFMLDSEFVDFESRRLRYNIFWSFYGNDVYSNVHKWAKAYRTRFGLYKYIRNIYNPAYRLGEFWKSHLWGGMLDKEAGDDIKTALPIETQNEALRLAIAQLWQWSQWQARKDIITLYGSILGDIGIKVIDDIEKERVYLSIIHPGKLADVQMDAFGNVKSYVLQEQRLDPVNRQDWTGQPKTVTYTEIVENTGSGTVSYQTQLDGRPYDWTGNGPEWQTGYGFVPLVLIKHNDVGLDWGWSELQPDRSKIHEVDDLASKLSDQIRKSVDAPWLFAGVSKPASSPITTETSLTGTAALNRPQPGREELPALYATDPQAKAQALIAELDIPGVIQHIDGITADIERDYPELEYIAALKNAQGELSGKALRIAQQPVVDKVEQRRVNYDDGLKRAHQMAVAIGGERGYFQGFNLASFEAGALDHEIAARPVFNTDPLDDLEILEKKFTIGQLPKLTRWRELGYDEDDTQAGIPKLLDDMKQDMELTAQRAEAMGFKQNGETDNGGLLK